MAILSAIEKESQLKQRLACYLLPMQLGTTWYTSGSAAERQVLQSVITGAQTVITAQLPSFDASPHPWHHLSLSSPLGSAIGKMRLRSCFYYRALNLSINLYSHYRLWIIIWLWNIFLIVLSYCTNCTLYIGRAAIVFPSSSPQCVDRHLQLCFAQTRTMPQTAMPIFTILFIF